MAEFDDYKNLTWAPEDLLSKTSFKDLLFSDDARLIGLKGILLALIMMALGGVMALSMRVELAQPGIQFFGAKPYISALTLHGMTMVFGFAIPITISLMYYMLPKVLGVDKLESAWAAHLSFWTILLAGVLLIIARPDFTWTFYVPLSLRVAGSTVWMGYIAIVLVGVSEVLAGITLLNTARAWKRKTGGRWIDMPLIGWGALTEAGFLIISAPVLSLVGAIMLTDYFGITAIYDPARGGDALIFLWMFWFYGHPAVYLPLMPIIGVLYVMLPRMLGRPLWSHKSGVIAFTLLFVLGFGVFHHHFQPNVTIHDWKQRTFEFMTMMIIIPSSMHVFNWVATIWSGTISARTKSWIPFKFTIGAIFMIVYGGVSGFINGQISIDTDFIHNTYWIPAHFHTIFLGFIAQMSIAAIYFLFPYFTGRLFHQGLANLHFWLWQLGIFAQVTLMFALGLAYFPRWVVDYLPLPEWVGAQFGLSVAGFMVGLGFLVFIINVVISVKSGDKVTDDPWPTTKGAEAADPAVQPAE
jgi:cytochrome c oxidase subunit 1